MAFVVDTNLLLHSVNEHAREHAEAARWLERCRDGTERWFATWPVLYELLRVATHRRVFARPLTFDEGVAFVERLFASPTFGVLVETERHAAVLRELTAEYPGLAGSVMHDFHTVVLMREHGVDTVHTADAHFRQFTHVRALNPLAG